MLKYYEYDDLFQMGCLGLIQACQRFHPRKKCKFVIFAKYIIHDVIINEIRKDHWFHTNEIQKNGKRTGEFLNERVTSLYNLLIEAEDKTKWYPKETRMYKPDKDELLTNYFNKWFFDWHRTLMIDYYVYGYFESEIGQKVGFRPQYVNRVKKQCIEKIRKNKRARLELEAILFNPSEL